MKWLRTIVVFDKGGIVREADWQAVHQSYVKSIQSIDFPKGSGTLTLRRKIRLPNNKWKRNGVKYLRNRFLQHLVKVERWQKEHNVNLGRNRPQPELTLISVRGGSPRACHVRVW